MSNAEAKSLSAVPPEVEAVLARFLHDMRNQLGGIKLYAVFLKNSLANHTLEAGEGLEVCEKILQQIDTLSIQAKEASRVLQATTEKKA